MLSAIMLSVVMLSVNILSVFMLSVVMLIVVAPFLGSGCLVIKEVLYLMTAEVSLSCFGRKNDYKKTFDFKFLI